VQWANISYLIIILSIFSHGSEKKLAGVLRRLTNQPHVRKSTRDTPLPVHRVHRLYIVYIACTSCTSPVHRVHRLYIGYIACTSGTSPVYWVHLLYIFLLFHALCQSITILFQGKADTDPPRSVLNALTDCEAIPSFGVKPVDWDGLWHRGEHYVLLFPFGESGWYQGLKSPSTSKSITLLQHTAYRIHPWAREFSSIL